ncbi:hypothetical protein Taro_039866 [Colocasia esculenta]|uniref:Cytochrome P450 n=1 Tax=Colocasia esculenta TaxID=4460 RepID=A0A843WHN3_COLES|nr:hypothetical protein [Colocasia esculenta]
MVPPVTDTSHLPISLPLLRTQPTSSQQHGGLWNSVLGTVLSEEEIGVVWCGMSCTRWVVREMGFAWICSLGFLGAALCSVYEVFWARPERVRAKLRQQGIRGPPRTLLVGNTLDVKRIQEEEKLRKVNGHDYAAVLLPFLDRWRKEYGSIFVCSMGSLEILYVCDVGMVREINQCKSLDLGRPTYLQALFGPLFGRGIVSSNGSTWVHQRKVIAREFFMDKVKGMVELMVEATKPVLESWETRVQCEGNTAEITVDHDLKSLSADVALSKNTVFLGIPGMRYIPTSNNREIWRLERESRALILKIVKKRQEKQESSSEKDLLQSLLESSGDSCIGPDTREDFIVDNCKNIYFAGQETTATSAAWCLMLLASHPEWQARACDEVVEICGNQSPTADMLSKMKTLIFSCRLLQSWRRRASSASATPTSRLPANGQAVGLQTRECGDW